MRESQAIANATGGFYLHLDNGPAAAKAIIEQGLKKSRSTSSDQAKTFPIERYEWPLAAGILLLMASMFIANPPRTPR